jgi:hypothetical protein
MPAPATALCPDCQDLQARKNRAVPSDSREARLLTAARYCLDFLAQDARHCPGVTDGPTLADRLGLIGGFRARNLLRGALEMYPDGWAQS